MLSYHLLTRALIQRDNSPFHRLRNAVSSAIHGFVPHATYVDVARHVEEQPPADTVLSSRMSQLIQSDFNPLIDLVKGCTEEQFAQRWNVVNAKLQLGVTTLVRGVRYEARHAVQEDGDTDLRRRVMTASISCAPAITKTARRTSHQDTRCATWPRRENWTAASTQT
jgi:hypothetical protein